MSGINKLIIAIIFQFTFIVACESLCQPWNNEPPICGAFGLTQGQLIYVPPANEYQYAFTMANLTFLVRTLIAETAVLSIDNVPKNVTEYFKWGSIQFSCRTFLRPCVENEKGLELPQQISKSMCEEYKGIGDTYLIFKYGTIAYLGFATYQYAFNKDKMPLNCATWDDLGLTETLNETIGVNETIKSFIDEYIVDNITIVSYQSKEFEKLLLPGCDQFGFEQIDWTCYMLCPTPIFSENQYETIDNTHTSFAVIYLCYAIIFILIIALFFTRYISLFPYSPIIVASFVGILLNAAFIAPNVIGHDEVWCNSGTSFALKMEGYTEFDSNGITANHFIPIASFEAIGNSGILQGVIIYFCIIYLFTLKTVTFLIIQLESALIFWGLMDKDAELHKLYKLIQYLTKDRYETTTFISKIKNKECWIYYGIKLLVSLTFYFVLFIVIFSIALGLGASGNITFGVGQTFNFISSNNKTAIICAFFVPILIFLVIDFICYVVTVFIFIFLKFKVKMKGTTIVNLIRILTYSTIMIVVSIIISILVLYVSLSTDLINQSMSDYINCDYIKGLKNCDRDIAIFLIQIVRDVVILSLAPIMQSMLLIGILISVFKSDFVINIFKKIILWSSSFSAGSQMNISTIVSHTEQEEFSDSSESIKSDYSSEIISISDTSDSGNSKEMYKMDNINLDDGNSEG